MFRIINTTTPHTGPRGIRYIHDAARPFAVLFAGPRGELCAGRYPTQAGADSAVVKFTASRARYSARQQAGQVAS